MMAEEVEPFSSNHRRSISLSTFPQPALTRLPSTSDLSVHSSDDLRAPDAAAALAGIHLPETDMEPGRSGHRRRRSSLMNALDTSAKGKTKRSPRSPTNGRNSIQEDPKLERPADESTSEDVELNELSEDGLQDDEETGLTGEGKDRRKRRRRRNTLMDQRVAGDIKITAEERKEADQFVLKNLFLNGVLIGLWYLFSLSISIVCLSSPSTLNFAYSNCSITNGCSIQNTSTSISRYSRRVSIC